MVPLNTQELYDFANGTLEFDSEIFDRLYDYYISPERGENVMPYGTAKARDGDPYLWIEAQLRREIEAEIGQPWSEVERLGGLAASPEEFVVIYSHELAHAMMRRHLNGTA